MKNNSKAVASVMAVVSFVVFVSLAIATEFPHRKDFPSVSFISSQDLKAKYDKNGVIVVDVRSQVEYDVMHVNKSLHISMAYATFVKDVEKVIKENPKAIVAFYCNGITCLKSYEAAQKMAKAGYTNCYAYDAGIPEWSKLYPRETILLGKVLTDPEKQLIPDEAFKKRLINFETFQAKAAKKDTVVIDVRDYVQSSEKLPGLENVKHIPLDTFIPNFVSKKELQDKTLLIFDQVGKQVNWLMYHLQDNGYEKYYFLNKGATSVLKEQKYK